MRQLYYIVQLMLMDPGPSMPPNEAMLLRQTAAMAAVYEDQGHLEGLAEGHRALRQGGRHFEALKIDPDHAPAGRRRSSPRQHRWFWRPHRDTSVGPGATLGPTSNRGASMQVSSHRQRRPARRRPPRRLSRSRPRLATTVDYNSFLKLLVQEMKNQDPTSPTDPTQYLGQLASFSNVEQAVQTNGKLDTLLTTSSRPKPRPSSARRSPRRTAPIGKGGLGRPRERRRRHRDARKRVHPDARLDRHGQRGVNEAERSASFKARSGLS